MLISKKQSFIPNFLKGFLIIIVALCIQSELFSKIKVTSGSTEKKQRLIQMFRSASFPVLPPSGSINFDTLTGEVTMTGSSSTFFGQTLQKILNDTGKIELSLDKSVNGRPVFIGGFNGGINSNELANGRQSLDINDFNRLDSIGHLGLGSWVIYLMHELIEQYVGWKYRLRFGQAHDSALAYESEMIFNIGGVRYRREGDIQRNDTVYMVYKRDGSNERIILKFPLDQYGQVQNVSRGIIEELKTSHISGGCGGRLCGFSEGNKGTFFETFQGTEDLSQAEYLISDNRGNIYASIPLQKKVLRMNLNRYVDREYSHPNLVYPSGLAYDPLSEELFIGCAEQNHVVVFDVNGAYKRTLDPSGLNMIAGMDIDPEGNLYIVSHGSDSITHMTAFGEVIKRIGNSLLQGPAGIVYADGLEKLFVVSNTNNKILIFNSNGSYEGTFGAGVQLSSPWGINIWGGKFDKTSAIGTRYMPLERLAVTNAGTNGIVVFNPDGTLKSNLSQNGFQPKAILITKSFDYSVIGINSVSGEVPALYHLHQNYPNPFNPVTKIKFSLVKASSVKLTVYDMNGREIKTLINENMNAGIYETEFNGSELSSGVYFYRVTASGFTDTKKMILVK